jgi:hypothetical protein
MVEFEGMVLFGAVVAQPGVFEVGTLAVLRGTH